MKILEWAKALKFFFRMDDPSYDDFISLIINEEENSVTISFIIVKETVATSQHRWR